MFGATPASSGFTFAPPATASQPPEAAVAKELLESIKKVASIDQAFQVMHDNLAQKAAFLELRPLHALVRSPPIAGSFNATMAEKVLSFFATHTPPILEQESAEHYTPLMQACVRGDLDAVRFFLDKGADINKEVSWQSAGWFSTRESHTPLQLACKHAQVAVTQLLLERGADAGAGLPLLFVVLQNSALSHANKMALGMALLPHTNLTNYWPQLLNTLVNCHQALPLFQKLLTLDDKIKEWKFPPHQNPLIQLIDVGGGDALPEWIDELLRNGHKFDPPIDVNAARANNGTPVVLFSIARSRPAAVIKTLVKHGADPNARDESGQVPLLAACATSQGVIDELLAAGADIFAVGPDGRTALHAALRYGHGALARSFIEKGVDTNARDASGNTALGYALVYDRWDVVDKLLTDANLDEPIQWLLHRPMMRSDKEAQDRERARVIQKRLAAGKKPPRRNYEQENELYELVDDHVTHSVKAQEYQRLAGVNSQMLDARGKTPLLFCVAAGWTAVMMRILARRPELSWQTCNIAADWDGLASRYEGMRVDISPAAYAALHGQTKALKLLFKYADGHLDVNAWMEWDGVRQQYIHTFLNRSDDQIALQSLSVLASLGQPVEVNNRDKRGRTPLHHAASRELPWCVWRLLQLGADPSIVDNWGNSPLAYAANASAWDICRQLLSAGADLNAFYQPPRKGRNPRERKGALIGILVQGIPVEVLKAITEGQQLAPEHMYELLVDSQFDFVHHLLKQCSKGPLFAFTKNTASDLSSKPAQKVLKLLFAAVKDYGCTARNERGDTLLTALAREQQPDADSSEDSPKDQARFAALTLALIAHGVDLAERNVDGDTFFHVVARDHQSTELLKSLLAAIHSERAQRLAQPQTSTSTTAAAEAKMEGVEGGEQDMDVECAAAAAAAAAKPEPGAAGGEDEKSKPPEEGSLEARVKRALEVRNGRGQTPLLTAVRPFAHAACRNTEVMSLLLALGANPQDREHGTGNTALFYAVMTDNQAGVRKLLELGLDINGANDKGETPLFVAGRQNLWKMSLFLLLSGANPHAINEAGECVLLVSSGFCAAIIHDFVARPRSLSFIVGALFPELVAGLPNYRPAANEPAAITTTSTPLPAAMTSSSSSLPQASHTDSGNSSESAKSEDDSKAKEKNEEGNENEAEQEAEEPPKTLLDNFPEILHQLNDVDTATGEGGPASSGGLRKREQNKRQRMNAAVKQVTELLRRVLDALQLYEGALDEADVAPDSNSSGDQGDEQHRRARWERNASLTRLKEQLAGWLRKSEARIPRITRNLSFTTLSEGEMALYLRQWKSLRRQRNQRKRKRGEEVEEDFFAETSSSQPQEEWIDVKRPRLEGQGQGDDGDGDDLPLPPLTVPEVESIPLPPPFVLFDDAVPFDALAPLLIRRTRSLVAADAKAAIPSASNSGASYKAQEDDDDDSVDLDDDADKTGVDTGVGLLAEEGYLLDASLTKVDDVEQPAKLQALFVRSKVTAVNVDKGSGNEAEKTTVMDVESTDNKSEAKESESENENKREAESEESEKKKEEQNVGSEWRCGFFVWDSIEEIEEFDTREAALAEFKRRFAKFTGHAWDDRAHFRHDHDNEAEDDEAPVVDTNTATTNDGDKAEQQGSSAMAVDDVDKEKAKEEKEEEKKNEKEEKEKDEEEKESGGYCYLPTDHRAVLRHRRYSKLYGDEEEEGSEDEEEQQEDDNLDDDEESDGEEESLRAKQKKEPSADQRLYDMLAFISHKKRLWSFCNRVGLFEITDMGQLTSTQIKNAYRILNVLSGILTYKKEMKARKRAVPEKVSQAIGELSNQFHRVLPFNFHGHSLSLNINKRKILAEKLNLLQSLQEIGIGMEVLHEVALPYKRRLMGDDEEELPTQDALSLPLDDDEDHLQQTTPTTTMPLEEKERLERAAGEINEDHPLDRKTSDSAQAMARMQLLCAALRARLTPVDKSSDEWKVIVRLMSTSSVKVLDAFEVEREGEKERFQPFAALPYRSLLCHGTGVYNILGILRKGMCIAPKEANGSGTNFGKGLYFADFPDKSVSYMSSDHGKGCFFLCDVALGEPLVRTSTGFRQPLPPGRHHCWGVGKTITHPEAVLYTDGGLRIPMGEDKRPRAGMGHNEFIVYNEGQVRIRYLLLVQEGA